MLETGVEVLFARATDDTGKMDHARLMVYQGRGAIRLPPG
jgi:hypothetical protein